jgi:hypothetical protein
LGAVWLLSSIFANVAHAAAPSAVDLQLSKYQDKIHDLQQSDNGDNGDKIVAANAALMKYLKSVCTKPELINDPLKKANDSGFTIKTSDDKKLRYYSWDTETGGTMHFFDALVAWDAGNGKWKFRDLNPDTKDMGCNYDDLKTVRTNDGQTVYIVQSLSIGSGMAHGYGIEALTIKNGNLIKYGFFQTPKKLLDSIDFSFGQWDERAQIQFTDNNKTIKIPVIKEDAQGNGVPNGKYLIYEFDGKHYVFNPKKHN